MKKITMKYAKQVIKDYNSLVDVLTDYMDRMEIDSDNISVEEFTMLESEFNKNYQSDMVLKDDRLDLYYFTSYYKRVKIKVLFKNHDISLSDRFEVLDESGEYQKTNVVELFTKSSKRARFILFLMFFRAMGIILPSCSLIIFFATWNKLYLYLTCGAALLVLASLIFYRGIINICFKDEKK